MSTSGCCTRRGCRGPSGRVCSVGVVRLGRYTVEALSSCSCATDPGPALAGGGRADGHGHARRCPRPAAPPGSRTPRSSLACTYWFEALTRAFARGLAAEWALAARPAGTCRSRTTCRPSGAASASATTWPVLAATTSSRSAFDGFTADTRLNRAFRYVVEQSEQSRYRILLALGRPPRPDGRGHPRPGIAAGRRPAVPDHPADRPVRPLAAFALARLFLTNLVPLPAAGLGHGFAFVLDMNKLFEGFLLGFLTRHKAVGAAPAGAACSPRQPGGRTLAVRRTIQPRVRPAAGPGVRGRRPVALADAKYKRARPGGHSLRVGQDDFYQAAAVAARYDCRVVLVYPQLRRPSGPGSGALTRSDQWVEAVTVELRDRLWTPAGRRGLADELRGIFGGADELATEKPNVWKVCAGAKGRVLDAARQSGCVGSTTGCPGPTSGRTQAGDMRQTLIATGGSPGGLFVHLGTLPGGCGRRHRRGDLGPDRGRRWRGDERVHPPGLPASPGRRDAARPPDRLAGDRPGDPADEGFPPEHCDPARPQRLGGREGRVRRDRSGTGRPVFADMEGSGRIYFWRCRRSSPGAGGRRPIPGRSPAHRDGNTWAVQRFAGMHAPGGRRSYVPPVVRVRGVRQGLRGSLCDGHLGHDVRPAVSPGVRPAAADPGDDHLLWIDEDQPGERGKAFARLVALIEDEKGAGRGERPSSPCRTGRSRSPPAEPDRGRDDEARPTGRSPCSTTPSAGGSVVDGPPGPWPPRGGRRVNLAAGPLG